MSTDRIGHTTGRLRSGQRHGNSRSGLILCYHMVGPGAQWGRSLNIEARRLASHVWFFVRRNVSFVLPFSLAESRTDPFVCFTFDDAYSGAVDSAVPIFDRFDRRAAFYAVAGKAGGKSDWPGGLERPLADFDALRTTARIGHEVGSHSMTHPKLAELSRHAQRQELMAAHAKLQAQDLLPKSICYPYGSFDASTVEVARSLGYKVGLSLLKGPVGVASDPMALPRVVVAYSDALPMLLYKIHLRPRLRSLRGAQSGGIMAPPGS